MAFLQSVLYNKCSFFFYLPTWLSCAMLLQPRPKVISPNYYKHFFHALVHKMSVLHFTLFWPKKRCSFFDFFFMLINIFLCECCNVHSLSKCLAWVACLWSKMLMFHREWGRESYSISFSIFASYDMKCLWFKFGYNIFTGFKMARP